MTFVGKILIVVQVILALMFMAFAGAVYTAQTNWKNSVTSLNADITRMTQEKTDTDAAYQKLKEDTANELTDFKNRSETAEAARMTLEQEVAAKDQQNARLKAERDAALEESRIASEEARSRIAESNELRDVVSKARSRIVEQVETIRGQQDDILSRDRTIETAEVKQTGLLDDMANMERLLRINKIDPEDTTGIDVLAPPPPLKGQVVDARRNKTRSAEFVHVSLGHDDGLRVGHRIWVYREDQFLAEIHITVVRPDEAVGVVIERARNGIIQRGDYVTSRL